MRSPATPRHAEARRLLAKGFKLVELHPMSKRPVGEGWNHKPVAAISPHAGGYGLLLAANGICSVDPDNVGPAGIGMARCGFDLEGVMQAGCRTTSTRPASGGRSTFKVPPQHVGVLRWVKFSSKTAGTILELRAQGANLQDCLPGTTYTGKNGGGPYVQGYAAPLALDAAPDLPADLLAWWLRLSSEIDFLRAQQSLFAGPDAQLAISSGTGELAFESPCRGPFNADNAVADILRRHDYSEHRGERFEPPTSSSSPGVRAIAGKDGLWQSDNGSDPLHGMFDAWVAHVVLDFGGDLASAERAFEEARQVAAVVGFTDQPVAVGADALPAFERSRNGRIKPTQTNLVKALSRPDLCGFAIAHDTFLGETRMAPHGGGTWRALQDVDYVEVVLNLEKRDFAPVTKEALRDTVAYVADQHQFDSAQAWLNSLIWDGVPRVDTFMHRYMGTADTPYPRAVSAYLWSALAARVIAPGVKADMVPILVGAQGVRKSTAVEALVPNPDLFTTLDLADRDDDQARRLKGRLVAEIAELKGLRGRDAEHVKAFITRTAETWVPKYREQTVTYQRRCVLVGTSNRSDFLGGDETGNRRFLPVVCERHCDPEGIAKVRDQLWAEGAARYLFDGVQHADAERLARDQHEDFSDSDPWENAVETWLHQPPVVGGVWDADGVGRRTGPPDSNEAPNEPPNEPRPFVRASEVLHGALELSAAQQTPASLQRISKVLYRLGYVAVQPRFGGRKVRGFSPKTA